MATILAPSYPELSHEDIILGCQAVGLHLTEQDLRNPSTLLVEKVWEQWTSNFLGINIEDSNRVALDRLDKMDYPEIYENAMKSRLFYRMVQQLTKAAKIDTFSNSDLTNPKPQRLVYALSGLINYQLFESEQVEETLGPLIEEKRELTEKEELLERESGELRERIAAEKARRLDNEPKVTAARLEEARRKEELHQMMMDADKIRHLQDACKAEGQLLANRKIELDKDQTRLQTDTNRLRSQIVRSPERLRQSVVELRRELERTTEELHATERKAYQLGGKISSLQKYEHDIESCNSLARDLAADIRKLNDGEQALRKLHEELSKLKTDREDLENELKKSIRHVEMLKQEIDRNDDKNTQKRETGKARKKNLEEQLAQLTESQRELDMNAADVNRKASEVEAMIRAIHNETHAILDKSEALYKEMVDSVGLYNLQVNKAVDALHTACASRLAL